MPLKAISALALMCLLVLAGCSSPRVVTETKTQYVTIPASLLETVEFPQCPDCRTYGDGIRYAQELKSGLQACNARIEKARRYQAERVKERRGRSENEN